MVQVEAVVAFVDVPVEELGQGAFHGFQDDGFAHPVPAQNTRVHQGRADHVVLKVGGGEFQAGFAEILVHAPKHFPLKFQGPVDVEPVFIQFFFLRRDGGRFYELNDLLGSFFR